METNVGMEFEVSAEGKKKIKEEKKKLKLEQKQQRKEAKQRAKVLTSQASEIDDEVGSGAGSAILVTTVIVIVWLGILALLVKLDVGGFGSEVLKPILKDVPVINKILPVTKIPGTDVTEGEYYGYTSLQEAVDQIKVLEVELATSQESEATTQTVIEELQTEITRLQTFEDNQVQFQQIQTEFYEEVIFAENGPGPEAYQKYYESIDPTGAEALYKQVVAQLAESSETEKYAQAYSEMKPKEAAAIFEAMTDSLDLAARILEAMSTEDRGKILGAMDAEVAARLTKIMEPGS